MEQNPEGKKIPRRNLGEKIVVSTDVKAELNPVFEIPVLSCFLLAALCFTELSRPWNDCFADKQYEYCWSPDASGPHTQLCPFLVNKNLNRARCRNPWGFGGAAHDDPNAHFSPSVYTLFIS